MKNFAVIFDMDGVIINSNPYVISAWEGFCREHQIELSSEKLASLVFGRTTRDTVNGLLGQECSSVFIRETGEKLDGQIRNEMRGTIQALDGLENLLETLKRENARIAIATSAPPENVEVVLYETQLGAYFEVILDQTDVTHGKPHPEIYLKTAQRLNIPPQRCIVIEDSISGVQSAKRAGMSVVAITTTHPADELRPELEESDRIIKYFNEISADRLRKMVE
jgi:HAD superfamily hydrolase (TIGR01509 family)